MHDLMRRMLLSGSETHACTGQREVGGSWQVALLEFGTPAQRRDALAVVLEMSRHQDMVQLLLDCGAAPVLAKVMLEAPSQELSTGASAALITLSSGSSAAAAAVGLAIVLLGVAHLENLCAMTGAALSHMMFILH